MCFDTHQSTDCRPIAPADLLEGSVVGVGMVAWCCGCYDRLRTGQSVTAYAYRLVDARTWDVAQLYCEACAPDRIRGPTLGAIEVLVRATLGTQSRPAEQTNRLCLVEPAETAYSGPDGGVTP